MARYNKQAVYESRYFYAGFASLPVLEDDALKPELAGVLEYPTLGEFDC
jgi:hypothetical protein